MSAPLNSLTVVVTNFRRAEKLRRALDSLVAAGIKNVVVSSACPDVAVLSVVREFPGAQLVTTAQDFGCNETWMRGCYFARTKYVLILHDDDWLEPEFGRTFENTIFPHLERGVGFASWIGQGVRENGEARKVVYMEGATRVMPSAAITKKLLVPNSYAVSPVVSVFRRDDCIRILKEADVSLRHPECFTRPTMMVGNDLLLYLRHAEKYQSWLYVAKVLTNYGSWEGSETEAAQKMGGKNPLPAAYNKAREVFLATRGPQTPAPPRLIHVYSDYTPKNPGPGVIRRHNYALKTWEHQYNIGKMIARPIFDDELTRSSRDLGDKKQAPFVKDLVEKGIEMAMPEDRVVLTNRDTCLTTGATERLLAVKAEAAYGVRQDIFYPIEETTMVLTDIEKLGRLHCGADLFSTSPGWWRKWRDWIPDAILSYETWDLMIREVCVETQPGQDYEIRNMVYHEYHETFWAQPENRYAHPAQVYVLRNAKNFYHSRGSTGHYSLA